MTLTPSMVSAHIVHIALVGSMLTACDVTMLKDGQGPSVLRYPISASSEDALRSVLLNQRYRCGPTSVDSQPPGGGSGNEPDRPPSRPRP